MKNNSNDKWVSLGKGVLGAVPFVGPLIAEVVGTLIPNQRIDRIEALLVTLEKKLEGETRRESFQAALEKPHALDLVEDAFVQASRSLSSERTDQIASLLKNSLTETEIEYLEGKRLFAIFGLLTDIEVLILHSHLYRRDGDDQFWERHKHALKIPSAHFRSTQEELNKHTVAVAHRQNLVSLGLLKPSFMYFKKGEIPEFDPQTGMALASGYSITPMGKLLLERIDIEVG